MPDKNYGGTFTFRKGDRKSQVDICLSNRTGIEYIDSFEVKKIGWNPSDHHPIVVSCTLPLNYLNLAKDASQDLNTTVTAGTLSKPKRIKDNLVNWESYSAILETDLSIFYDQSFEIYSEERFNEFIDYLV